MTQCMFNSQQSNVSVFYDTDFFRVGRLTVSLFKKLEKNKFYIHIRPLFLFDCNSSEDGIITETLDYWAKHIYTLYAPEIYDEIKKQKFITIVLFSTEGKSVIAQF